MADDVNPDMHDHILGILADVEREQGVRVLFAAESGSRAWGFASPDSDHDVRFIYAHPAAWYLRLVPDRDVIERPLDARLLDLSGWDLRKALQLLLKSNPTLYEWLRSPMVYRDDGVFAPAARDLYERHASLRAMAHHYASMARGSWRTHVQGREAVVRKKYFYVVRPLLCLRWLADHQGPPPMALWDVAAGVPVPAGVRSAIQDLIAFKQRSGETGTGPRLGVLDAWIGESLEALAPERLSWRDHDQQAAQADADALFLSILAAP